MLFWSSFFISLLVSVFPSLLKFLSKLVSRLGVFWRIDLVLLSPPLRWSSLLFGVLHCALCVTARACVACAICVVLSLLGAPSIFPVVVHDGYFHVSLC